MNPRPIGIARYTVLSSLTPYVADVLLRTDNNVAGAMLLILGGRNGCIESDSVQFDSALNGPPKEDSPWT